MFNKINIFAIVCVMIVIAPLQLIAKKSHFVKVLVFYKTAGFYHTSIPTGIKALQQLGFDNGFAVDTTTDSRCFTKRSLKRYSAIVFLSTTGNVLNEAQKKAFKNFIQSGHGFVGIHSAASTEKEWPWYNQLVGAYLSDHPEVQHATIHVIDKSHPATSFLPTQWQRVDEWYNFRNISKDLKVLALIDENTYTGGKNGTGHPFAWYHDFEGGKAFYTAGGHLDACFAEPLFLKHLLGGINYASSLTNMNK